jgi:peptidoglycan/LPS O-acetylase OafA/YrhL
LAWLRHLGKISYAMYVFHPLIFSSMYCIFKSDWSPVHGQFWPAFGIALVFTFSLTVLVSQTSQVFFERPILKLKDYFQYQDRSAPLAK